LKKINVLYLLGAGRSGTTLLASLLNSHPEILFKGELNQLQDYIFINDKCSCGKNLSDCLEWSSIYSKLIGKISIVTINQKNKIESHRNIPSYLLHSKSHKEYLDFQNEIFSTLYKGKESLILLDSSKYISRYLQIYKSNFLDVKGIYLVRDIRGVINSFNKNVQTSKKPFQSIVYYLLINTFGEITYRLNKKNILKIRYEDLVLQTNETLTNIYNFIGISYQESFKIDVEIPHIVGGNRLKSQKKIKVNPDFEWKRNLKKRFKIIYYLLSFPFMILNKYKL
jgi:hypothetical protein